MCSLPGQRHGDDEDKIDFGGGNVHVVTSKEDWDQKVADANKDGKIVSETSSSFPRQKINNIYGCFVGCCKFQCFLVRPMPSHLAPLR
jgi:hypothetical protein